MRALILCLLAISVAACTRLPPDTTQARGCERVAHADVTFSSPSAPDRVTARSEGPTCGQTFVILTLRNAAGDPIWAHAGRYDDLTAGGEPPPNAPAPTHADIDRFLAAWAHPTIARTSALPAWTEGKASLTEAVQGMSYATDFNRETYEMLRARDLPDLCFAVAAEGSECIIMDPFSHEAETIVRFGP